MVNKDEYIMLSISKQYDTIHAKTENYKLAREIRNNVKKSLNIVW